MENGQTPLDTPMRSFFTVWTGQAVSLAGSQLVQFGLVWWLARSTGSATVLAYATLVALLPQIFIAPFAGALVDRWNRRRVMLVADSVTALATLVLAFLFWQGLAGITAIYMLMLVRSAGSAFHLPAMIASTTLMVPRQHLPRIAGMNQALFGALSIFIPPIGALAVENLPMQGLLAIDVVTALPAIAALLVVAIPQPPKNDYAPTGLLAGTWADMRAGMRFLLGWKGLMLLFLVGVLIHMLGRASGALLPLLVLDHFQQNASGLGFVQSADGLGAVLGGIALGIWGGFRRKVVTQMVAMIIDGVLFILIGLSGPGLFLPVLGLFFCAGLMESIAVGIGGALGQILIPPHLQGRLFALSMSITQALAPLGLVIAGPITDALGVGFWFGLTGGLFCLIGAGGLLIPALLNVEDPVRWPQEVRANQAAISQPTTTVAQ